MCKFNHSLAIIKESSLKVVQVIFLHITKPCFTRQPNPGRGLFMETYMNGLSPKGMKSGINHNN